MHFINWRDYLVHSTGELANTLNEAFLEAEYFIACVSNYYKLKISLPTIVVHESTNNNSAICYENKSIVICEGLLKYLFVNEGGKLQTTLEERVNHFLWSIAHEYFHYARRHNEVKNEISSKSKNGEITELNINAYAQVLEDDADRLATAALYRHFIYCRYKENNSFENKLAVLNSLFEPIRLKISGVIEKNSISKTHPVWSARLFSQIIKLSELDTRDLNIPLTIDSETIVQQSLLQDQLLHLEKAYLNLGDESEKNLLYQYLESHNGFIDLENLNLYSEKIYPLIYEKCCLPGLNGNVGEWTPAM